MANKNQKTNQRKTKVQQVMAAVKKINDLDTLKNIKEAIRTATDVSQVLALASM